MNGPWGFCERCAFEVPVDDGLRVRHRRTRSGDEATEECAGSGKPPPDGPTPTEAKALPQPSLLKSHSRTDRRSYWYNRRQVERASAESEAAVVELRLSVGPPPPPEWDTELDLMGVEVEPRDADGD